MYHTLVSCRFQVPLAPGLSCIMSLMPGGASRARLKSNTPFSCASAEILVLILEFLIGLRVVHACRRSLHHRCIGDYLSVVSNPSLK